MAAAGAENAPASPPIYRFYHPSAVFQKILFICSISCYNKIETVCNLAGEGDAVIEKTILYESNMGVLFEQTITKDGRCKVVVKNKDKTRKHTHGSYHYKYAPDFDSPYISWANLNCCGGWVCDETYLHTAVQKGQKLYAGIAFSHHEDNQTQKQQNDDLINKLKQELPSDCIMGNETPAEHTNGPYIFQHMYICKTGAISDYIDIEKVFAAYEQMGVVLDNNDKRAIMELCRVPIQHFADRTGILTIQIFSGLNTV